MRTETGQQESKPTTRRARGEGRKQPAGRKPAPKAQARKSTARANKTESKAKSPSARASRPASKPAGVRASEAEEAVDRMGDQIGRFATLVGREVLKAAARAREEIEDMLAEAQSIRDNFPGPHSH